MKSRLVCEEYILNLLHNGDEKKDGTMGLFRRIFGKADSGLVYGSSENPRPLRRVDSVKEDLRTTMEHFLELKDSIRPCIKEAETKLLEAETCLEGYQKEFDDSVLRIMENGRSYWEDKSSYPEVSALHDKIRSTATERADALKELREWNRMFYLAYGYKYKSEMYDLNFHVNGILI